jgi:hypothetical protein
MSQFERDDFEDPNLSEKVKSKEEVSDSVFNEGNPFFLNLISFLSIIWMFFLVAFESCVSKDLLIEGRPWSVSQSLLLSTVDSKGNK